MDTSDAYIEWKNLYDDTVYKVWREETNCDLRKVSMMLFVIKKEFKKITDTLQDNFNDVRKKVCSPKRKPSPNIGKNMQSSTVIINKHKENLKPENTVENTTSTTNLKAAEASALDSPDMFLNESTSSNSKIDSILISDDDDDDFMTKPRNKLDSPEIKKGRRSHRVKARKNVESPSRYFLKDLGIKTTESPSKNQQKKDSLFTEKSLNNIDKMDKSNLHFEPNNTSISFLDKNIGGPSDHTPVRETEKSKNDTLDLSIIPCTPTPISKSSLSLKQNSKIGSFISKNLSKNGIGKRKKTKSQDKNSTLTQMFKQDISNLVRKPKEKDKTDYDSDRTYFDADNEIDEENSENIGLTKILSLINTTDRLCDQIPSYDYGDVSPQDHLENPEEYKESLKSSEKNNPTKNVNSEHVETETLEQGCAKGLREINELLAKAQGVADQLEAAPVVRGKARKQLPGWACEECQKFYGNQGLTESQVVTLNKCTKHRGLYRPREDTMPGYWDLTMATQIKEQK